jgi:glycogen debranching enzyme
LAIATDLSVLRKDVWREVQYSYDARRGTHSTPWVYDLCSVTGRGCVCIATAQSPESARRTALEIFSRKTTLLHELSSAYQKSLPMLPAKELLTFRALESLHTRTGIVAGLPWFFQEWSRDELIAVGGMLAAKRYSDVINILDKWFSVIQHDGTLPAIYPDKGLPSADGSGWLGKRTRDLLLKLSDENIMHLLKPDTIAEWRDATGRIIDDCRSRFKDGLIWTAYDTTWMDTSFSDDGRAGARIEIQALFLALFDAHVHLCTMTKTPVDKDRAAVAKAILDAVHQKLYVGGKLYDGLHADGSLDVAVRPNIFIAWYVAPKLFSQSEWKLIFDIALAELWLPWGGLSSIGIHDSNFHDSYTGENVASYHRGDSWYFVNNMAAQALFAVDPEYYNECVHHIFSASMDDFLAQGFAGHCSELSSAKSQDAAGCYAQAWSVSTLLELQIKLRSTR